MNNRSKIVIFALTLISALLLLSTALAQNTANSPTLDKLYGSWNVEVMTVNQPGADGSHKFPALVTFGGDGTVIADEPPSPGETSGHGNWISNSDGTAAYTFVALYSGENGAYNGKLKVVGTLQYDSASDSWKGPFKIDVFDKDGKVMGGDTGTFNMARMEVESLD